MTKATWGGKGLSDFYFHIAAHHRRKSGQELKLIRDLEEGADVGPWCWVAYWLPQFASF